MPHSVVIGGAGFIGSWVVEEILKSHESRVTVVDNLISSERWNLSSDPRVTFIQGSASEFETFERILGPVDTIYQLACFHGNQSSIAQPLNDLENGLKTTLVTLEWARENSPNSRIVYSGAGCAVAEKTWDAPIPINEVESTSLVHDSPYSISKIAGEMHCIFFEKHFNLDVVRVRFQNVFGPREILGAGEWRGTSNTIWRNVVPTFIYKALKNEEIEVFGNRNASRDFTFVEDVARGVVVVAEKGIRGNVYNIATGMETFIHELATLVVDRSQSKSKVSFSPKRIWDNSGRRVGNGEKIASNLNFSPSTPFIQGLDETIEWTRKHLDLIEHAISKHKKYES